MSGPVEGVALLHRVIQGPRVLLFYCSAISLILVFMVKAGFLLLWYSSREEKGMEEHIPSILRPRPGSGPHNFFFCSAGENIVIGPYPATREAEYLVTMLLQWPSVDRGQITRGPICHPGLGKRLKLLFSMWVFISEICWRNVSILQPPFHLWNLNL